MRSPEGILTTIDFPGARHTFANGINNGRSIVGYYVDSNVRGFHRSVDGLFTTIDLPGATWTDVYGINDAESIVGSGLISSIFHGFLGRLAE